MTPTTTTQVLSGVRGSVILPPRGSSLYASLVSVCLLLAGMAVALLSQGAYYADAQWAVGAAAVGAALVTVAVPPRRGVMTAPVLGCLLLAGWSLLRGLGGSTPLGGVRPALLVLGLAAAFAVVRRLTDDDRALLTHGLLALGGAVALAGWVGVVWHVSPYALSNDGVWRATSTLTYANALAAVLGCLALVLAGIMSGQARQPVLSSLLALLLVGTGATLSRAGLVALVAGCLFLLALRRPGPVLRACAVPAFGAAAALVGLLPSMPLSSPAGRPVAVVALLAGLAIAAWLPAPTRASLGRAVLLVVAVVTVVTVVVGPRAIAAAVDDVAGWRAHVSSPARVEAARAGLHLVAERPWAGAGPGDGWTSWRGADGSRATMRYVHDEYLQVAVDLGLPGLLLVVMILLAAAHALRTALRVPSAGAATSGRTAGACAALLAAMVHAGFDFVWHVPAVALLVAVVVGLGSCPQTRPATAGPEQKGVVT